MAVNASKGYRDGAAYPECRLPGDYAELRDVQRKLHRAAGDCQKMGWDYLRAYFVGKLSVVEASLKARKETQSGKAERQEAGDDHA